MTDYCVTDLEKLAVPKKTMREILMDANAPDGELYPGTVIETAVLLKLLTQSAEGMAFVHSCSKQHLDIKPEVRTKTDILQLVVCYLLVSLGGLTCLCGCLM